MKFIALCFALTLMVFASCKKYEDGPAFSILSKKARLTGEWELRKIVQNGNDITSTITTDTRITFKKDGSFQESYTNTTTQFIDGNWEFDGNKDYIFLSYTSSSRIEMEILRLTNIQLRVRITTGSTVVEKDYSKQ